MTRPSGPPPTLGVVKTREVCFVFGARSCVLGAQGRDLRAHGRAHGAFSDSLTPPSSVLSCSPSEPPFLLPFVLVKMTLFVYILLKYVLLL